MATEKVYDLSLKELSKLKYTLYQMRQALSSEDFMKYIADKCMKSLKELTMKNLTTINEENVNMSAYMNGHHMIVEGDTIILYNDSKIDVASKNMSEVKKANYPAQLSLSKIVEYGIGPTGAGTKRVDDLDGWEYNLNKEEHIEKYGADGWYYVTDSGEIRWTTGFEGRLIYQKMIKEVDKNIGKWVKDYLDIKIKD